MRARARSCTCNSILVCSRLRREGYQLQFHEQHIAPARLPSAWRRSVAATIIVTLVVERGGYHHIVTLVVESAVKMRHPRGHAAISLGRTLGESGEPRSQLGQARSRSLLLGNIRLNDARDLNTRRERGHGKLAHRVLVVGPKHLAVQRAAFELN